MAFAPQHRSARNLVLPTTPQTVWGTAQADGQLTYRPLLDPSNFAVVTRPYWSDMAYANKGHDWATQKKVTQQDVALALNFVGTDLSAGWAAAYALMADTVVGAGPYTHTCKFLQSTRQAKFFTAYFEDTADIKTKYMDLSVTQLKISGGPVGPLAIAVSILGSGKLLDGAMVGGPPAVVTPVPILGSDTDVTIGPQGAPVSIKERVSSWEVTIDNAIEVHRGPGGGLYGTMNKITAQRATVKLVVAAKDTDDLRTLFLNDTIQELNINTNSGASAQLNIKFPGLYVSADPLGLGKDWVIHNLDSAQDSVVKSGANEVVQITVINGVATYLV